MARNGSSSGCGILSERTQADIAARLGISQVQVSRMEKRILKRMRSQALRE